MTNSSMPKRIGQGMWALAWLVLLGLLYLYFDHSTAEKYDPNRALITSTDNKPVILKRNRAGHYVAPGTINNTPVIFLLDTGATTISIPQELADKIGLQLGSERRVNTANGSITVYSATLDSVQLGSITLRDIQGHINPHMPGDTVLLGMSFMKHLEMTQKGDYLTLKR